MDGLTVANLQADNNPQEQIIEKINIGCSPLEIVTAENKSAVVLGQHRITEWFNSKEELQTYMEDNWLDLIFRLTATMLEINEKDRALRTADAIGITKHHLSNQNQ